MTGKSFERMIEFLHENKEPKREALYALLESIVTEEQLEVLSKAHSAVLSYQPISAEGMAPVYRTAFEETRKGCHATVFAIWSELNEQRMKGKRFGG